MESNTPGGCHKLPEARHGDVGPHGDLVDFLTERLRAAVGPDIAADVDPEEQVLLARTLLAARGLA